MTREVVYVDSAEEQLAYLVSRFGPQGTWQVREQRLTTTESGAAAERAELATSLGDVTVEFRDATPVTVSFTEELWETERTRILDDIMEVAVTFAAENPPHHPGSLPRFPIPEQHYPGSVGVPLPVLAVDDMGRRGLFAPPRMAVVSWTTREPVGVREFPGFDPEHWPPPRLSDWPAPGAARLTPEQLEATIKRFSACWSRVIDAWLEHRDTRSDVLTSDVRESFRLRAILDPETMAPIYRRMNPRFDDWLSAVGRAS